MTPVIDRLVALLGLIASLPLLAISAIGIKFSSPGPVLYRARRAGLGGEPFTMFKLRTMHLNSEQAGRISSTGDSRVFPFGMLLRRSKVDELPQLLNVARGEMALVGPRPEDITIVEESYDRMMRESLKVPPGITSPGSLHYFADEVSLPTDPADAETVYLTKLLPRKVAVDLVYVRNRSWRYDMQIIVRTVAGVLGQTHLFAKTHDFEINEARRILEANDMSRVLP